MTNFINLTPHPVTVGEQTVPASGTVARVAVTYREVGEVDGVPVVQAEFGQVTDLPEPADNVIYVVSGMVRQALKGRADVVAPDTGPTARRTADGQIAAVTRLIGVARG